MNYFGRGDPITKHFLILPHFVPLFLQNPCAWKPFVSFTYPSPQGPIKMFKDPKHYSPFIHEKILEVISYGNVGIYGKYIFLYENIFFNPKVCFLSSEFNRN